MYHLVKWRRVSIREKLLSLAFGISTDPFAFLGRFFDHAALFFEGRILQSSTVKEKKKTSSLCLLIELDAKHIADICTVVRLLVDAVVVKRWRRQGRWIVLERQEGTR